MNSHQLNPDTEALIQGYLEGTLTPEESTRLLASLKSQPELIGVLLDGLRMDVLIREVVSQTQATRPDSTTLLPESASTQRSRRREEADRPGFARRQSASSRRRLRPHWNRPLVLALAASVLFFIGLTAWYFGPTVGLPELAEINGDGVTVERGTKFIPAITKMALEPADVLRLGTNASATIVFGAELTRLELSAGTELKLTSLAGGKRFFLQDGRIEASVARQRPFHPMIITTPQAEARVLGTKFTLLTTANATRLEVSQGKVQFTRTSDNRSVQVGAGHYAIAATNSELAALPATGSILREYWTNLVGARWFDLITYTNFPDRPDGWNYLTNLSSLEMPSNWADNYGMRLRGYLHPPATGPYIFWIAAKDNASLWLSWDEDAGNKVQIANSLGAAPRDWQKAAVQQSASLELVAGRKYYFEVLHKAAVGDDNLAVAWQPPGRERAIISSEFLSPFRADAKEKKR